MECAVKSPSNAFRYGVIHGTCMFFDETDSDSFLDYMQTRLTTRFPEYMKGFVAGKLGEYANELRCLKSHYVSQGGWIDEIMVCPGNSRTD